jgi:hypothetical protein
MYSSLQFETDLFVHADLQSRSTASHLSFPLYHFIRESRGSAFQLRFVSIWSCTQCGDPSIDSHSPRVPGRSQKVDKDATFVYACKSDILMCFYLVLPARAFLRYSRPSREANRADQVTYLNHSPVHTCVL